MKLPILAVVMTLGICAASAGAADATSPIDYTQRNQPYAPLEGVAPVKQKPAVNHRMQERRVDKATMEKQKSALGERQAAVEVKETRAKVIREKDTRPPEVREHVTSRLNHRPSSISTAADTAKPPTVARYQDSLAAASAANMARFPAVDRATTAKINRFVFRKNPGDSAAALEGSPIVPAAGGSGRPK
jgi:hypothetical protein